MSLSAAQKRRLEKYVNVFEPKGVPWCVCYLLNVEDQLFSEREKTHRFFDEVERLSLENRKLRRQLRQKRRS